MAARCSVLDQKYVFEYEVGLWTFGTMQVRREMDGKGLKLIRTIPKAQLQSTEGVMSKLAIVKQFQHPHLVGITDALEDKHNFYVVSDLCQGGDVQDWMERFIEEGYHLQELTVVTYLRQLLLSLSYSHARNIYHRDLRPSCLSLTSKMPDATVKVADIGLAAIFDSDNRLVQNSPIRNRFTAPEILSSADRVCSSAPDMWSVGAIAHAMLVGKPPAQDDTDTSEGSPVMALIERLRGTAGEFDQAWAERSPEARDFVQQLLQPADERPTPAVALQHPWLKSFAPIGGPANRANNERARELKLKSFCYSLAVLLVPSMVPHRDFEALRIAFEQHDGDGDGFVSCYAAQEVISTRCRVKDAALAAIGIVDIREMDVIDLCAMANADLIAREFFANGPTGQPITGPFHAKDLAPRMLKRFFEVYGTHKEPRTTVASMTSKLQTSTAGGMENFAGVSYDEILASFPVNSVIDSQSVISALTANAGRGTPIGNTPKKCSRARRGRHSPWMCESSAKAYLTAFTKMCSLGGSRPGLGRGESPHSFRVF